MPLRIGWNSNGFASHRLDDALPILADHGFDAVAITPDVPHLDPRYTTPQEVRRVGKVARDLGLEVVMETGARYLLDARRKHRPNLLEPDDSKDVRLKFLRHMLEWCDLLDARVMSFWSGVLPDGQSKEGARIRLAEACENLHSLAERYGVKLGLEPEPGHFVATLEDYSGFVETNPGWVGLTLDTGHLLANEEQPPEQAILNYQKEIVTIQLDDAHRGVHAHLAPGEGDVDWPAVRRALDEADLDVCACWELGRDSHRFHSLVQSLSGRLGSD